MKISTKSKQFADSDAFGLFELADIAAVLFDKRLKLLRCNAPFIENFVFSEGEVTALHTSKQATTSNSKATSAYSQSSIALSPYLNALSNDTTHISVEFELLVGSTYRLNFTLGPNETFLLTLRELRQIPDLPKQLDKLDWSMQLANKELAEFSHAVNHDLRSPMRALRTIPDWISDDLETALGHVPTEVQCHLEMLQKQARRLETMLDDLLTYTKIGRDDNQAETVSLNAVLQQLQHELSLPEGFHLELPKQNSYLCVPEQELRLALRNLIDNAFRHHHSQHSGRVVVEVNDFNDQLQLCVIDDGPGIPSQYYHTALTVFSTLASRDQLEGSGMGLPIAKKIVDSWGGTLSIHPGLAQRGTCISLSIPPARRAA